MAASRARSQMQVGSSTWLTEERAAALQIADEEVEEFTFSARNEMDWLNEHMAEVFNNNQFNVAEMFKTPGKLRGKTPRTARKRNPLEERAPLTDIFSTTPQGNPSPFRQQNFERPVSTFKVAEDKPKSPSKSPLSDAQRAHHTNYFDSGYHGSQSDNATVVDEILDDHHSRPQSPAAEIEILEDKDNAMEGVTTEAGDRRTTDISFKSAKEDQSLLASTPSPKKQTIPRFDSPGQSRIARPVSPPKPSAMKVGDIPIPQPSPSPQKRISDVNMVDVADEVLEDDQSQSSEGSSPIRPIVRKSSLNFASLPAREPLTTKKSIGARTSRTSHLDHNRTSHYGRHTGGKSFGNSQAQTTEDEEHTADEDAVNNMDIDNVEKKSEKPETKQAEESTTHNTTSTQRLQDQIRMLGRSQSNAHRPSKSIPSISGNASQPSYPVLPSYSPEIASPERKESPKAAPGAFPEDDEDSWIGPPTIPTLAAAVASPRPVLPKSFSTDVMEGLSGKDSIGGSTFQAPKQPEMQIGSPLREIDIPEQRMDTLTKSVSMDVPRSPAKDNDVYLSGHKKGISVSNPNISAAATMKSENTQPPPSPTRSYRDSPLKASKDKLSSILKFSKGLFVSSAAVSAEAKTSTFSPAPTKSTIEKSGPSFEDALRSPKLPSAPLYPTLSMHDFQETQAASVSNSPLKPTASKTSIRKPAATTDRDDKRKEKEAREAQLMAEQLSKLDKAREKEAERARVFSQEREKAAEMERKIAAQKEQEKQEKLAKSSIDLPRATRTSPRKTKAQLEAEGIAAAAATSEKDLDITDGTATVPPPTVSRPGTTSQIGRPKDTLKRPLKPAKEPIVRSRQPPAVIRVETGSQRNHQHPTNAALANSLQDSLAPPSTSNSSQVGLKSKASGQTLHHNKTPSTSSFDSIRSKPPPGKPKALQAAERKKAQDELQAQRKLEMKREIERKRAASQEEERQREREQLEAKKLAQRQQAIEKKRLELERAKQQRAPPPAARPQAGNDLAHALQDKPLPSIPQRGELGASRPISQMNSAAHRSQEDMGRPVNGGFHNTTKAPPKRPLQQENSDDGHSRPTLLRSGPSYQNNDAKRRKTEDEENDAPEIQQPRTMAPPIRQSTIRQKDAPTKSMFPSGYTSVSQHAGSSLHKATLTNQHMHQSKPGHPMDMSSMSKGAIPFAQSSSSAAGPSHKTPARPLGTNHGGKSTVKSAARSSPRFQNGDSIDLPEINTDSEDDDSDAGGDFSVPDWANSPAIRAQLAAQDNIDPAQIFGPVSELKMEEIFKNKDRWGRFRARTSSANWSGQDRLTEDEVKKDLEGREKIRRQGGWTPSVS